MTAPVDPAEGAVVVPPNDEAAVGILTRFVDEHGPSTATVDHLGRSGARIVVMAADGRYGDAVVSSLPVAQEICRRAAVPLGDWDRARTSRITPTPADWKRMAGSGR
ncbi:hypothetical protein JL107_01540 [Nakamurella flavida]|uniref:Uncharacterized protein n=1 Tax=Nakamurella flavida TaxID=363630 RepID=A0A938YLA7_9ACTN|nr:hypothetical protein [Nakamurella flavida]MBM9475118.1 hypothetical protein [Nakamurella flavida]MDP9776688.1 hypothetical protein [Nakamurella flavida]